MVANLISAAENRTLEPSDFDGLGAEALTTPDEKGRYLLHVAAKHGGISAIPQDLITQQSLLLQDVDGNNPIHIASVFGSVRDFPEAAVTEAVLVQRNRYGMCAVQEL